MYTIIILAFLVNLGVTYISISYQFFPEYELKYNHLSIPVMSIDWPFNVHVRAYDFSEFKGSPNILINPVPELPRYGGK
jgi:hypothetical protein